MQVMHETDALVAISVRLPEPVADRLKEIATRECRTITAEVRRLITAHIETEDAKEAA
jgi:predicted DNA-binding protein